MSIIYVFFHSNDLFFILDGEFEFVHNRYFLCMQYGRLDINYFANNILQDMIMLLSHCSHWDAMFIQQVRFYFAFAASSVNQSVKINWTTFSFFCLFVLDANGNTPLFYAAEGGFLPCVALLLVSCYRCYYIISVLIKHYWVSFQLLNRQIKIRKIISVKYFKTILRTVYRFLCSFQHINGLICINSLIFRKKDPTSTLKTM